MSTNRTVGGAIAGAVAAGVWAAQQPLDKRIFDSSYDDVELVGKLFTRGPGWQAAGTAAHLLNGAVFGAVYANVKAFVPGPAPLRGVALALAENFGTWPLVGVVDAHHPARGDLTALGGNRRALAQSAWRHALFGLVLGVLEDRLNSRRADEPLEVPASSNGHGQLMDVAVATVESGS